MIEAGRNVLIFGRTFDWIGWTLVCSRQFRGCLGRILVVSENPKRVRRCHLRRRYSVAEEQPVKTSVSPPDGQCVIRVQNLSKCYQLYDKPQDQLQQAIYPRFQRLFGWPLKDYAHSFWALAHVSFDVKKGETVRHHK